MILVDQDFIPIQKRFANQYNLDKVLKVLGNPELKLPTINIVGTNGKGSTSFYLSKGLTKKYKKVGLFISPAFLYQNERIQINGELISDDDLHKYLDKAKMYIDTYNLTFFEIWTLMGILYFSDNNCDVVIMEAGIGGKKDTTYLMKNQLMTLVTSISFDHTDVLGESIEEIVEQKVNMAKDNSTLVISKDNKNLEFIIKDKLVAKNIEIIFADFHDDKVLYQRGNKGLVKKAFEILNIKADEVFDLAPPLGRFTSIINNGREIIIDGAHNEDGIKKLIQTTKSMNKNYIILYGSIKTKNYLLNLENLNDNFANVYITNFESFKAWDIDSIDYKNKVYDWKQFIKENKEKNILVCGSLYFIPQVYNWLMEE